MSEDVLSQAGPAAVVAMQLVFVAAVFVVWINQAVALWRFRAADDGLHRFRLMSVLQGGSWIAFGLWRALVWSGVVLDDPRLWSHPDERWPADLIFWSMLALSAVLVAYLYYSIGRTPEREEGA